MLCTGKEDLITFKLQNKILVESHPIFRVLTSVEDMPMENQQWNMQLRAYLMQQLLQLGIEGALLK